MKKIIVIVFLALFGISAYLFTRQNNTPTTSNPNRTENPVREESEDPLTEMIVAENLDTPWGLAFLPDKSILVTERSGVIRLVDSSGVLSPNPVLTLGSVKEIGEGGLLGIAIHPEFTETPFVYVYYTYGSTGNNTQNKVVRMTYENQTLTGEETIVDAIPGASNHNGGRIAFGPDNYLYITTGDAQDPSQSQDRDRLGGKILRVTPEGEPAPGNPFGTRVYSYGHRNPQGIAWDSNGNLWATEHGPSGIQSGNDEINRIESGKNYGWPTIQGTQQQSGMETPKRSSGTTSTWAPGGSAFVGSSLFFAGLRGQALYEAVIENDAVTEIKEHLKNEYGRIREVVSGPDGMLYITTSNRDGRGTPKAADDVILRIDPQSL